MATERIRILRTYIQAECAISIFIASEGGVETIAAHGVATHPRTNSTGASISLAISVARNTTFDRAIRESGRAQPLRPTAHRIRLHLRRRPSAAEIPILANIDDAIISTTRPRIMSSSLRNWKWESSTSVASGEASILVMQGSEKRISAHGRPKCLSCNEVSK